MDRNEKAKKERSMKHRVSFKGKETKLLLISSSVFLLPEIERACQRLGVSYKHLALDSEEMDLQKFVDLLTKEIKDFSPDALLTLNHSGVDREGILFEILEKMQVPLVSWFVDNPHLLLSFYSGKRANAASSWLNVFTWDKDNIASLQEEGYTSTFYLPLGTDATRFHPNSRKLSEISNGWESDISFVGTSMFHKVSERLIRSGFPQEHMQDFFDLGGDFALSDERSIARFIERQTNKKYANLLKFYNELPAKEAKFAFQAGLTWEATRVYRLSCVKQILDFNPLVVGDDGWKLFFEEEKRPWRWHDNINYYNGAHKFYTQSVINFNCTSMQMKGASNQRIFDVPAAGSFVLTDYREQMTNMFELEGKNKEIVCYRDIEEIPDLVRFYLAHDTEREKIIQMGRKRVLACHTWDHRVQEVLAVLQEKYGISQKNKNISFSNQEILENSSIFSSSKKSACISDEGTGKNTSNSQELDFWQKVRKKRFQEEPKLLFIDTGHFLLTELSRACRRMGIKYKYLRLVDPKKGDTVFIEQLLKDALVFAPDAIFTFNSFGVDPEGKLLNLLEKMQIPLISWFVDNPENILAGYDRLISPWSNIFTFDKDSILFLEAQGFDKVHYLPLATDVTHFHPENKKKILSTSLQKGLSFSEKNNGGKSVSFVGDSVINELEKRFKHSFVKKNLYKDFVDFGETFLESKERSIQKYFLECVETRETTCKNGDIKSFLQASLQELLKAYNACPSQDAKLSFFGGLLCAATKKYRSACVTKLLDFAPIIVGDLAWQGVLETSEKRQNEKVTEQNWILHDPIPYRNGLQNFYAHSTINFNSTSTQMKGAPNQRVFDVSACESFILTDYREQLEDLFNLSGNKQEMVCYKDVSEIPELITFYLSHDAERKKIAQRARERVIACHTWEKRIEVLLKIMKEKYFVG